MLVLYGPKAVGKSWVARTLAEQLGVHHVDVEALVLELLAAGARPDPADAGWRGGSSGWLLPLAP